MSSIRRRSIPLLLVLYALPVSAQMAPELLTGLEWRDVGPMRGGRTFGVSGHADEPDTFYMGSVGGGVWKTENAGRTWVPISDEGIPIGSIGAIAVAPSNPKVVYVGTGESDIRSQNSYGIGMFKSMDAGKTWSAVGLEGTRQISRVMVDPTNADRVYVAALGNIYGPNPERGVYRSTDGGSHWKRILFDQRRPIDVGAADLAIDPKNPRIIYASLWSTRRPPWSVYAPTNLPGGGLFKSVDGGDTWKKLGGGLPNDDYVGRIGIAVAPSNPKRLWAAVDDLGRAVPPSRLARGSGADAVKPTGGIYISDDAGATWRLAKEETRLGARGWYFNSVSIDPTNADHAFVINTTLYVTSDGGKTFLPLRGAPGGDDYHQLWINPKNPKRMVLSSDQGTIVTVDGAKTWSSWYNQPTAEIYHLSADNRFPYWLYGAQQDSGGVGVSTFSREGVENFRNWEPTCLAGESATVLPDPKDGNILYGEGNGRCDQTLNAPVPLGGELPAEDPNDPNRKTWTLPQVFSAADEALYYANQFVMRSRDRGKTWEKISPDLARVNPPVPDNLDPATAKDIDQAMKDRFGVVYSLGPSPLEATTVWAGTDDGSIYVTRDDGKSWTNVTPPAMTPWSKVSQVEAGHFDSETAYASVDRHRLTDNKPYIYRTHDGGKTWQNIVAGIPDGAYVNSVKEDTKAKGLLYAATELRVYVSFDDGEHWQSLQNNMPVTSIRDIVVHGDDIAIATHGRGFWVLDQMSPLRELTEKNRLITSAPVWLFQPGETYAIRPASMNGTPLPHDEPQEANPSTGVVAYYHLKTAAKQPLKLELISSDGKVKACAASDAAWRKPDTEAINVEAIWEQSSKPPAATAGMHRFAIAGNPELPFGGMGGRNRQPSPTPKDACTSSMPPEPPARTKPGSGSSAARIARPSLEPGPYVLRLTVDGETYEQQVTVKPEPTASTASMSGK